MFSPALSIYVQLKIPDMKWEKEGDKGYERHILRCGGWLVVTISPVWDGKYWGIGSRDSFSWLYPMDRRFRKIDVAKKFVEKEFVKYIKRMNLYI